jgi:hypothetical protein
MVSPTEWGPNAWQLLHGIAERIGNTHSIHMDRDQRNELRLTLRHFWALLPCQKCQNHYREWLHKFPPDKWISSPFGSDLKDEMRSWLFRLHTSVNQQNNSISTIQLDQLPDLYNSVDLQQSFIKLKSIYERGVQSRVLKAEEWKVASKHLSLLLLTL